MQQLFSYFINAGARIVHQGAQLLGAYGNYNNQIEFINELRIAQLCSDNV